MRDHRFRSLEVEYRGHHGHPQGCRALSAVLERAGFATLSLEKYDGTRPELIKVGAVHRASVWISLRSSTSPRNHRPRLTS
jgi:hypothetical protein